MTFIMTLRMTLRLRLRMTVKTRILRGYPRRTLILGEFLEDFLWDIKGGFEGTSSIQGRL